MNTIRAQDTVVFALTSYISGNVIGSDRFEIIYTGKGHYLIKHRNGLLPEKYGVAVTLLSPGVLVRIQRRGAVFDDEILMGPIWSAVLNMSSNIIKSDS